MPALTLAYTDIGLFTDFEATRVEIRRLQSHAPTRGYAQAFTQFEGDTFPTPFTGTSKSRIHELGAKYLSGEHDQMADLIALFEAAHDAADSRLLLRPNSTEAADLNAVDVVVVNNVRIVEFDWHAWIVQFTAAAVAFSVEV